MAENPFGQGGPEEEELPIAGNPIDTAEVPPALAEAIASGEMTELEDGSVEVGEFVYTGNRMFQLLSKNKLEAVAEVPSFRTFNLSIAVVFIFNLYML